MLYYEDFPEGHSLTLGPHHFDAASIIRFAEQFDPQPFHLDANSAAAKQLGGLIASGWHTCSVLMRMMCDAYLLNTASQGSAGLDEVRWLKPVFAGDTLSGTATVDSRRVLKSRPDMGVVNFTYLLSNQKEEPILRMRGMGFVALRAPEESKETPPSTPPKSSKASKKTQENENYSHGTSFYERLQTGIALDLGAHTFEREPIIDFAKQFDPQRFHLSDEGAAGSHFDRLCASGWHTSSQWMRQNVEHSYQRLVDAVGYDGPPVAFGPSPGFRNLRWYLPVYAGDTVHYRTTLTGKRALAHRPGWGLLMNRAEGFNQDGERVVSMDGAVTVPTG
ncbi:MAG: MaoC/PaaZ C-terminal domain-containing protein [Pseudomonadota bacterium]